MIIVCGEVFVDLIRNPAGEGYVPRPAGSATNVAVALGRQGRRVVLLARLSQDCFGTLVRDHLRRSFVDLQATVTAVERTTLVMVDPDPMSGGEAATRFYIDGCAEGQWCHDELPEALPDEAALHVSGSLALAVPAMGEVVDTLIRREYTNRVISFDPNPCPAVAVDAAAVRTRLNQWLRLADIVKVSLRDLAWLAPNRDYRHVARQWLDKGCLLVIITRGDQGVYALGRCGDVSLPAHPVELVDRVGAGDAFMGGMLTGLDSRGLLSRRRLAGLTGVEMAECLRQAQRIAAFTCGREGAEPPWREELRDLAFSCPT